MSYLAGRPRHPSYHLRPNKAIDRLLFVELLRALELARDLSGHLYIGFGGPFLEDFRVMAAFFPYLRMISVEIDKETSRRQQFHLCSRNMKALYCKFEDYLSTGFPTDRPTIVWADYTDFDRKSLLEVSDIARKASPWSVLRVTVKAESPVYEKMRIARRPRDLPKGMEQEFAEYRGEFLQNMRVEDVAYDEALFTWNGFREDNYPSLAAHMILAIIHASCTRPKVFVPLQMAKYSDGTIMLSVAGVVCLEDDREKLQKHFEARCPWYNKDPNSLDEIDVPILTTKERLHLEEILPSRDGDGQTCLRRLGYLTEGDNSVALSRRKLQHYERYYRLYPYFGRLIP